MLGRNSQVEEGWTFLVNGMVIGVGNRILKY